MKVFIAIDSFKGSLTSEQAGMAVAEGARKAGFTAEFAPLADGGEGTVRAFAAAEGAECVTVPVTGPYGKPVAAEYCVLKNGTAVMETASAAGLTLAGVSERNPMVATTYGLGQLIAHAAEHGIRRFMIGLGGSATNDGGAGMLQALGFSFKDGHGKEIPKGAQGLKDIESIEEKISPYIKECSFSVLCDVNNPLFGENGASSVYGPQKGATPEDVKRLDGYLVKFSQVCKRYYPNADPFARGAGAAGGLGFAFMTFLNARLVPGTETVIKELGIEQKIAAADVVATGEGRLDRQTAMGKAPAGIALLAKKYNKPAVAFAGCVSEEAGLLNEKGISAFFCVQRGAVSLEEAMEEKTAYNNLESTAEQTFRLISAAVKARG